MPLLRPFASLLCLIAVTLAPAASALPTAEDFFTQPAFSLPRLSPSGKKLAVLGAHEDVQYLALIDLESMQPRSLGSFPNSYLLDCWWKGEDMLLLLVANFDGRTHFRTIDLKKGIAKDSRERTQFYEVLHSLPNDPDSILVVMRAGLYGDPIPPSLLRFNVRTGKSQRVATVPEWGDRWVLNDRGEPVAVTGSDHETAFLFWRKTPAAPWQRRELGSKFEPRFVVQSVHADQKRVIAWERQGEAPWRAVALDPETMAAEPIFTSPEVDPDEVVFLGQDASRPYAIQYETDQPRWRYLDASAEMLAASIDRLLPGTINQIVSSSANRQTLVIKASRDNDPGRYYLFSVDKDTAQLLGDLEPTLANTSIPPSRHFKFVARDGLPLSGRYYPPWNGAGTPPLIVMVGPSITTRYASYGFDPEAQFLASRGYAVAYISYRGTEGFGRAHTVAGDRQLATGMPNDLEDGVRWLIAQGWADERRVALFGYYKAGLIGLQALAQSSLFSAWINVNTPMNANDLEARDIIYSEIEPLSITRKMGGFGTLNAFQRTIDGDARLPAVKVPSFHYYVRNPNDNTPIANGQLARRFFDRSGLPHVFLLGSSYENPYDYYWDYSGRGRVENRSLFKNVEVFLARYFPATASR